MRLQIRCPACHWEPDGGAYWLCSQCAHVWNTFETVARCPSCGFHHTHTACIPFRGGCEAVSLHEDWYEGLEDIIDAIREEIARNNFEII